MLYVTHRNNYVFSGPLAEDSSCVPEGGAQLLFFCPSQPLLNSKDAQGLMGLALEEAKRMLHFSGALILWMPPSFDWRWSYRFLSDFGDVNHVCDIVLFDPSTQSVLRHGLTKCHETLHVFRRANVVNEGKLRAASTGVFNKDKIPLFASADFVGGHRKAGASVGNLRHAASVWPWPPRLNRADRDPRVLGALVEMYSNPGDVVVDFFACDKALTEASVFDRSFLLLHPNEPLAELSAVALEDADHVMLARGEQ